MTTGMILIFFGAAISTGVLSSSIGFWKAMVVSIGFGLVAAGMCLEASK